MTDENLQDDDTEQTKPPRPVDPGPSADPAEHQRYAQQVAAWEEWLENHPEDGDDDGVEQELEESQARDAGED